MTAVNLGGRNILIASREKDLLDTIAWMDIKTKGIDPSEWFTSICASYRLNDDDLKKLSAKKLTDLDFCLMPAIRNFTLPPYFRGIQDELERF